MPFFSKPKQNADACGSAHHRQVQKQEQMHRSSQQQQQRALIQDQVALMTVWGNVQETAGEALADKPGYFAANHSIPLATQQWALHAAFRDVESRRPEFYRTFQAQAGAYLEQLQLAASQRGNSGLEEWAYEIAGMLNCRTAHEALRMAHGPERVLQEARERRRAGGGQAAADGSAAATIGDTLSDAELKGVTTALFAASHRFYERQDGYANAADPNKAQTALQGRLDAAHVTPAGWAYLRELGSDADRKNERDTAGLLEEAVVAACRELPENAAAIGAVVNALAARRVAAPFAFEALEEERVAIPDSLRARRTQPATQENRRRTNDVAAIDSTDSANAAAASPTSVGTPNEAVVAKDGEHHMDAAVSPTLLSHAGKTSPMMTPPLNADGCENSPDGAAVNAPETNAGKSSQPTQVPETASDSEARLRVSYADDDADAMGKAPQTVTAVVESLPLPPCKDELVTADKCAFEPAISDVLRDQNPRGVPETAATEPATQVLTVTGTTPQTADHVDSKSTTRPDITASQRHPSADSPYRVTVADDGSEVVEVEEPSQMIVLPAKDFSTVEKLRSAVAGCGSAETEGAEAVAPTLTATEAQERVPSAEKTPLPHTCTPNMSTSDGANATLAGVAVTNGRTDAHCGSPSSLILQSAERNEADKTETTQGAENIEGEQGIALTAAPSREDDALRNQQTMMPSGSTCVHERTQQQTNNNGTVVTVSHERTSEVGNGARVPFAPPNVLGGSAPKRRPMSQYVDLSPSEPPRDDGQRSHPGLPFHKDAAATGAEGGPAVTVKPPPLKKPSEIRLELKGNSRRLLAWSSATTPARKAVVFEDLQELLDDVSRPEFVRDSTLLLFVNRMSSRLKELNKSNPGFVGDMQKWHGKFLNVYNGGP